MPKPQVRLIRRNGTPGIQVAQIIVETTDALLEKIEGLNGREIAGQMLRNEDFRADLIARGHLETVTRLAQDCDWSQTPEDLSFLHLNRGTDYPL